MIGTLIPIAPSTTTVATTTTTAAATTTATASTSHSTETSLVKVQNDILTSIDQHGIVILILLDLSAAFDTIDHDVLFSRMESTLGITGPALEWFRSYLGDRTLRVQIDDSFSASQEILWSVPQGSVLGPLLFLIYLLPLGILIRKHGLELHAYADDTQLYTVDSTSLTFTHGCLKIN